eukprot:gene8670-617_t
MNSTEKLHLIEPTIKVEPPVFYFKNIDLLHETKTNTLTNQNKKHHLDAKDEPVIKKPKTNIKNEKTKKNETNTLQSVSVDLSSSNEFYASEELPAGINFTLGELSKVKKTVIFKYDTINFVNSTDGRKPQLSFSCTPNSKFNIVEDSATTFVQVETLNTILQYEKITVPHVFQEKLEICNCNSSKCKGVLIQKEVLSLFIVVPFKLSNNYYIKIKSTLLCTNFNFSQLNTSKSLPDNRDIDPSKNFLWNAEAISIFPILENHYQNQSHCKRTCSCAREIHDFIRGLAKTKDSKNTSRANWIILMSRLYPYLIIHFIVAQYFMVNYNILIQFDSKFSDFKKVVQPLIPTDYKFNYPNALKNENIKKFIARIVEHLNGCK